MLGAFIKMYLKLGRHHWYIYQDVIAKAGHPSEREYGKSESAVMHQPTSGHLYILYICIYLFCMSNQETNAQDMKSQVYISRYEYHK